MERKMMTREECLASKGMVMSFVEFYRVSRRIKVLLDKYHRKKAQRIARDISFNRRRQHILKIN